MPADADKIPDETLQAFVADHRLPESFHETVRNFYLPLSRRLPSFRSGEKPLLLGINGAQGTGKSTLAEFLQIAAGQLFGWRSAVLSIDDFYLTRAERKALAREVHPLFETRGVPGTHDTRMLGATLDQLQSLAAGERMLLPRFDKSSDEREARAAWPSVDGPLDMIVLEGWCVGSKSQSRDTLRQPVNALEREEDPDAAWRTAANNALATRYEPLFEKLDALVFIAAPSFDAIFSWRLEQEQKLEEATAGSAIMNQEQLARFIRHYERITRHNLHTLPLCADVVLELDEGHAVVESRYRSS